MNDGGDESLTIDIHWTTLLCRAGELHRWGRLREILMHDIDWTALAEEFKNNHRPHAGHFSWESDRAMAEVGVLDEFANALAHQGILFFMERAIAVKAKIRQIVTPMLMTERVSALR